MPKINKDVVSGGLLMVAGAVWTGMVVATIPAGTGGGDVGARAFPLFLGVALVVMAASLLLLGFKVRPASSAPLAMPGDESEVPMRASAFGPALLIFVHIVAYGLIMEKIGFLFASILTVASIMLICVGDRSPVRVVAMSLGVPLGVWLVFGKLFGVYLTPGSWF